MKHKVLIWLEKTSKIILKIFIYFFSTIVLNRFRMGKAYPILGPSKRIEDFAHFFLLSHGIWNLKFYLLEYFLYYHSKLNYIDEFSLGNAINIWKMKNLALMDSVAKKKKKRQSALSILEHKLKKCHHFIAI